MLVCTVYILVGLALTTTIIEIVRRQYAQSWQQMKMLTARLQVGLAAVGNGGKRGVAVVGEGEERGGCWGNRKYAGSQEGVHQQWNGVRMIYRVLLRLGKVW